MLLCQQIIKVHKMVAKNICLKQKSSSSRGMHVFAYNNGIFAYANWRSWILTVFFGTSLF